MPLSKSWEIAEEIATKLESPVMEAPSFAADADPIALHTPEQAPANGPEGDDIEHEVIDVYFGEIQAERDADVAEAEAYLENDLLPRIETLLAETDDKQADGGVIAPSTAAASAE